MTTPVATGSEFQINTYTTDDQRDPSVTGLSDGGFVVTWESDGQDGSSTGIYGQRYNADGTTAGAEFLINTYTTSFQSDPSVTALSGGGFVVTWQSNGQDGSSWGIYGQRYNADGTTADAEFQINTNTTSFQLTPSVTGLSDGDFVVTWESFGQDGDSGGIYGQRYNADGTTAGAEFLINTYQTPRSPRFPMVVLSLHGNLTGRTVMATASMGSVIMQIAQQPVQNF